MTPRIPNGSTHSNVGSVGDVTIDDLVVAPQASLAPVTQLAEKGKSGILTLALRCVCCKIYRGYEYKL